VSADIIIIIILSCDIQDRIYISIFLGFFYLRVQCTTVFFRAPWKRGVPSFSYQVNILTIEIVGMLLGRILAIPTFKEESQKVCHAYRISPVLYC